MAQFLDGVITFATLGIGWILLSLYWGGDGQTVGKRIVGLRTVEASTGRVPSAGRTFLRDQVLTGPLVYLVLILFSNAAANAEALAALAAIGLVQLAYSAFQVVDGLLILGGPENATLKDRMLGTRVVKD